MDDRSSSNYAWEASGGFVGSKVSSTIHPRKRYVQGEVVGITLNLKDKYIEFFLDNESCGKAFEHIEIGPHISYRLAISMYGSDHSVSIKDFKYL